MTEAATMHDWGMKGKRVVILGGGGVGIGRAITRLLGSVGAQLVVGDVDASRAHEAATEVADRGGTAIGLRVDVRSLDDIERAIDAPVSEYGGLDSLVTVVGGHGRFAPWVSMVETTDADFDVLMDVNLRYVFRAVRAAARRFLTAGAGGSIVSVGSLNGVVSSPSAVAYGAAKAGLINLAKTTSAEYGHRGVRMNVVSCGVIMTDAGSVSRVEGMVDNIPLQRGGEAEEVADAVLFLVSPRSSYIAGQSLNIDGGATARVPFPLPNAHRTAAS